MRVGEYWEAIIAYRREQSDGRRHIAELTRGATMKLWNLQVDKRYRITDPKKFWRMPWDDKEQEGEDREIRRLISLSPEETQREVQKFLELTRHGRTKP